jgi:hypothetical protein
VIRRYYPKVLRFCTFTGAFSGRIPPTGRCRQETGFWMDQETSGRGRPAEVLPELEEGAEVHVGKALPAILEGVVHVPDEEEDGDEEGDELFIIPLSAGYPFPFVFPVRVDDEPEGYEEDRHEDEEEGIRGEEDPEEGGDPREPEELPAEGMGLLPDLR